MVENSSMKRISGDFCFITLVLNPEGRDKQKDVLSLFSFEESHLPSSVSLVPLFSYSDDLECRPRISLWPNEISGGSVYPGEGGGGIWEIRSAYKYSPPDGVSRALVYRRSVCMCSLPT